MTTASLEKGMSRAEAQVLLSVDDVCRILGITPHTFYSYRRKHAKFRTVKVGNRTYMRPATLDAFLVSLEQAQA